MPFLVNWKTTLGGVASILGALADLAHQASSGAVDPNNAYLDLTALGAGLGLIFAQDAKKN